MQTDDFIYTLKNRQNIMFLRDMFMYIKFFLESRKIIITRIILCE